MEIRNAVRHAPVAPESLSPSTEIRIIAARILYMYSSIAALSPRFHARSKKLLTTCLFSSIDTEFLVQLQNLLAVIESGSRNRRWLEMKTTMTAKECGDPGV
ncbi:MAG: hypothetical protein M9947_11890 [Thermomicrobiales bacterium]|nr:hypothetical protein [Thermomicrobiales bacterium]